MQWKTDTIGSYVRSVDDYTIALPLNSEYSYDFTVDWGDGNSETITTTGVDSFSHTYSAIGTYTVTVNGNFSDFGFCGNPEADNSRLISISDWGGVMLLNRSSLFEGCNNLTTLPTDAPINTGELTTLSSAFNGCTLFNSPLESWDVSSVTNMSGVFRHAEAFNQPLNGWDTSSVTDMSFMFAGAKIFNQDLDQWNTSNVTKMYNMFEGDLDIMSSDFNGNISTWNVSKVTDFTMMFFGANRFNQELERWQLNTTECKITQMFRYANSFTSDLSSWDTSGCAGTSFYDVFEDCFNFDSDLSGWNTTGVTDMGFMFTNTSFSGDVSGWDTSSVKNMRRMFYGCTNWSNDLSSWDISAIEDPGMDQFWDMQDMFSGSGLTAGDYSRTLIGWANASAPNESVMYDTALRHVDVGYYDWASSAKDYLVNTKGWTINDAGD